MYPLEKPTLTLPDGTMQEVHRDLWQCTVDGVIYTFGDLLTQVRLLDTQRCHEPENPALTNEYVRYRTIIEILVQDWGIPFDTSEFLPPSSINTLNPV